MNNLNNNIQYAKNFYCSAKFLAASFMKPNSDTLDITLLYDLRSYICGFLLFGGWTIYNLDRLGTNAIHFKNLTSTNIPLTTITCITSRTIRMTFSSAIDITGTHGIIILI